MGSGAGSSAADWNKGVAAALLVQPQCLLLEALSSIKTVINDRPQGCQVSGKDRCLRSFFSRGKTALRQVRRVKGLFDCLGHPLWGKNDFNCSASERFFLFSREGCNLPMKTTLTRVCSRGKQRMKTTQKPLVSPLLQRQQVRRPLALAVSAACGVVG